MPTMIATRSTRVLTAWELAEREAMRIPRRRRPMIVRVERGTVLVTRSGDIEDHVLEAGDELPVPRGCLAVAWAFTEATITVREATRSAAAPAPTRLAG